MDNQPELELVGFIQDNDLEGLKASIAKRIETYSEGNVSAEEITLDTHKLITALTLVKERIKDIEGRFVLWGKDRKAQKEADLEDANEFCNLLRSFYKTMLYSREIAWAKAKGVELTEGQHVAIISFNWHHDITLGLYKD